MIRSTWTIPLLLAALTCVGLVSALAGDGLADVAAWIGLGLPVVAAGWSIHRADRSHHR